MLRKSPSGQVTSGRVFGYHYVGVLCANETRSHVERNINDDEAAVVPEVTDHSAIDECSAPPP
jgi:hypothetical protein